MKELSQVELEHIVRVSDVCILPDVYFLVEDGRPCLPFYQLGPGEQMPDGHENASAFAILFYLLDLKGLLMPVIDARHGDPKRAAEQVAAALQKQG